MFDELSSKTALITGASRGIGMATAYAFAKAGCRLILTCHGSAPKLRQLSATLSAAYHIECNAIPTDVGNPKQVERLFSQIADLDILINNAGISHVGLLSDMSAKEWRLVMRTTLDSGVYTCKYAMQLMMKKHSGKIINISSVWGSTGASMEVAYSASKGGVNAFTKALAKELAPSNIQVNAIACGVIDTAMNSCFSPEDMKALASEIPADRIGRPEEVAALVLQTAMAPDYMTGQIITIDGGWC